MDWIISLFTNNESVAHIVILYAIVISVGVLLGKVKIGGIALGVTFVLFAGIVAGHFGFTAPGNILDFLRDFGLILFVFCIGLQVGPGFFESFKKGGITLNLLATVLIFLNVAVMFACYYLFFDTTNHTNLPMMVGTLYGAVTNTPGLGAANEALSAVFPAGQVPQIANGYACAYPLGVLGIIGATIAIRFITKVNLPAEEAAMNNAEGEDPHATPTQVRIKIDNSYIEGRSLHDISSFLNREFVCTRIKQGDEITIPNGNTIVQKGDEMLIVCTSADEEVFKTFGKEVEMPWVEEDKKEYMVSKRLVITNPSMNGKQLGKMHFSSVYGVNITRITRQGIDLFAHRDLYLQVGDRIMVVGLQENVDRVTSLFGNSAKRLNTPNIATIFIGILVGIFFGSIPIAIPGMPVPMKLGLAGGPLIIAILVGRYGYKLKLVTYTTTSANLMLREIGLVLFLASVGIKAGKGFFETIVQGDGLKYVYTGFLITVIPILIVGVIARLKYKVNYYTIMGMIAGTYTDPPALAYSNQVCSNEAASVGYSTVYPLSMFLRIFLAQTLILFFCA